MLQLRLIRFTHLNLIDTIVRTMEYAIKFVHRSLTRIQLTNTLIDTNCLLLSPMLLFDLRTSSAFQRIARFHEACDHPKPQHEDEPQQFQAQAF